MARGQDPSIGVHPAGYYGEQDIELLTGTRVTGLDVTARQVTLDDGRSVGYDALLLATGGQARRLPGVDGERVHHLRTRADSDALRARLVPGSGSWSSVPGSSAARWRPPRAGWAST